MKLNSTKATKTLQDLGTRQLVRVDGIISVKDGNVINAQFDASNGKLLYALYVPQQKSVKDKAILKQLENINQIPI